MGIKGGYITALNNGVYPVSAVACDSFDRPVKGGFYLAAVIGTYVNAAVKKILVVYRMVAKTVQRGYFAAYRG